MFGVRDEKEDCMNIHSRSRTRDEDKIRSLEHGDVHGSRSRSKERSRGNHEFRDDSSDGFRVRCGNHEDEKERVKWRWLCCVSLSFSPYICTLKEFGH